MQTKVFTVFEIMEILKLSEPTVRKLIKTGSIKSLKLNGAIRVTEEELNNFLKGN